MQSLKILCSAAVLVGTLPIVAYSAPVQYQFNAVVAYEGIDTGAITSPILFNHGALVSGSFWYDSTGIAYPETYPGTFYGDAFTGLAGSIGGYSFSDPIGLVSVFNDSLYVSPALPNLVDMFQLAAEIDTNSQENISGFQIVSDETTYELRNVRLFWIEVGVADFLTDESLPATLPPIFTTDPAVFPPFSRIGFDFVDLNNPDVVRRVFADQVVLSEVPVPGAVWMMLSSLGGLGALRYGKRGKL